MPSTLISGANRGLGLEFSRQYAEDGWRVFAGCRKPEEAGELNRMAGASGGMVTVHRLDVTRADEVAALADTIAAAPIDLLLNNAGVATDHGGFGGVDYDAWRAAFDVNVMGPMRLAEAFAANVAASEGRRIATLTSRMGSIGEGGSGEYGYRTTKAAANMVVKTLSIDLAPRGIIAVALHPGWVATDMGGRSAPVAPATSVAAMRRLLAELTPDDSGRFLSYDGSEILW